MGSKYRLVPHLADVFTKVGGTTALDAFSGSGVVSYLLKALGYQVTANDFLTFPTVIARATVVNQDQTLTRADIDRICGPAADDRSFIQQKLAGLYFTGADRRFLDSAWSHIDTMSGHKKDLAISALILAAARRQPRGVFTFTDMRRYDDGRRDLKLSLSDHFRERAAEYNRVVFDGGQQCRAITGDIFELPADHYDVVYLAPPTPRLATTIATSSGITSLKDYLSTGVARQSWKTPALKNWSSGILLFPISTPSLTPSAAPSSSSRTPQSSCPTHLTRYLTPRPSKRCCAKSRTP
jgi:SAM-dependent methyltransferase